MAEGGKQPSPSEEMEDDNIEWDNIIFHNEVGSGSFGTVHRVTFKKPYKGYHGAASKSMRVLTKGEVEIMQNLRHEHIVTYIGFYSHGPTNILLLEFASGGSLQEYLRNESKEISMDEKDKWANQAALALQYLHRNQCLHRDIKPENCLLFENNTLKLCDFGLARKVDCTFILSTFKGTCRYMAPEIIRTNNDNKSQFSIYTDVYAYGMLLFTIYTRKIPFEGMDISYVIFHVGNSALVPAISRYVPDHIARVMRHCWEVEPSSRPTIDQILEGGNNFNNRSGPSEEIEDDNIEWDNIIFHNEVGSGAFGTVHRVTFKKPYKGYQEAAAKSIRVLTKGEVEIMQNLRHEHIVNYIGFYSHGPTNILLMEFASGGSLLEYLRNVSKEISIDEKDKWAKQAALALQYLHRNQCLHRDVKPENCLLFENNTLKLCDFGLARETESTFIQSTFKGTYQYMAPEIIKTSNDNKSQFSIYTDIYAYGMLLYTIYTQKIPFEGQEMSGVLYNVGKGELRPNIPQDVPVVKNNVMRHCWRVEPKGRPTIEQILRVYQYAHISRHTYLRMPDTCSVALHPNGDIVIGTKYAICHLQKDGKKKMELKVQDQPNMSEHKRAHANITDIKISPQGHACVHKTFQSNIHVFSENGAHIKQFSIPNEGMEEIDQIIAGLTFDRDGKLLVANGKQGVITAHKCPSGEIIGKIKFKCERSRQGRVGMAVNRKNQILYHFSSFDDVYSKVVAIDHSGNELFAFSPKIDEDMGDAYIWAGGIVCDSHDNIFVAIHPRMHRHKGHLHKYSPTGAFLECIAHHLYLPYDISISHDDSLIAVADFTSVVLIPLD